MKLIDKELLDATTEAAQASPRLRMNHNFHESLDDPINRLLNAMEPGTYIRPHRHKNPDKNETFLLLRGRVALFLFDDEGGVDGVQVLDPKAGVYGGEIQPGAWHSLIVLESGSVVYEIKQGPFAPLSEENMAAWAPSPEDAEAVKEYMDNLMARIPK